MDIELKARLTGIAVAMGAVVAYRYPHDIPQIQQCMLVLPSFNINAIYRYVSSARLVTWVVGIPLISMA